VSAAPRRKRSVQRDRILTRLRESDSHPTAAELHRCLLPEMPALSLGTVYRNLEILVEAGEAESVPCSSGPTRYDGCVEPHHHFNCECCGRILDVDLPLPRGLTRRLAADHGLRSKRVQITFHGLCPDCDDESSELRAER
jgi:Fur family peroxide stress response transcriptional regulator